MVKRKKINLHNLSQAEMASREQDMLKGGVCACVTVCGDSICSCWEPPPSPGARIMGKDDYRSAPLLTEYAISHGNWQDSSIGPPRPPSH